MALELIPHLIDGYEKVVEVKDSSSGLHAIISVHSTRLGPSLGGTRIYPYKSFDEALTDVLRLSKGMTYKSALAGTKLGGGKSVIIADPKKEKTQAMLTSFAHAVNALEGLYVCAEDSGTTAEDMLLIRETTPYVVGLPTDYGSGDPGRFTAWGLYQGIKATALHRFGSASLKDKVIAIQGLGSVGSKVAEHLFWEGANFIFSDIDDAKSQKLAETYHGTAVAADKILEVECDIFVPCAMGGVLNKNTIPKLKCKAVAGAANNQLLTKEDGEALFQRGILYAPDYVINSGGVINVIFELDKDPYNPRKALMMVNKIYDTLLTIFKMSEQQKAPTSLMADQLAEDKLVHLIGKRTEPCHFR